MIAVTGANGLLGNFIVKKLVDEKLPVVALKRKNNDTSLLADCSPAPVWREVDLHDSYLLHEAFRDVDTVIHAAAMVSFDPRAKKRIFETNVVGTKNIVDTCLALGIPRLIFISSVAALGRKKGTSEIDEESKWTDSELNSDYAKSKYLAELEVFRGQEEGLSVGIINPSVILAPANINKSSAQVFKYVLDEKPFFTAGTINYVDARDVAEMVYHLCTNPLNGERYIASAGATSMRELLTQIAQRLGKRKPSIEIGPYWLSLAAWVEEWRCRITGAEALISRQSVKMPGEHFYYDNRKSVLELKMAYRTLEETLDWCCDYYRNSLTTNK